MNKPLKVLFAVLLLVTVQGCSFIQNTSTITTKVGTLMYYYDQGRVIDVVLNAPVSASEKDLIKAAVTHLISAEHLLDAYTDNPTLFLKDIDRVVVDYSALTQTYRGVRSVVINHWDSYSESDKHVLSSLDSEVNQLDEAFWKTVEQMENQEALLRVIDYVSVLSKVLSVL